MQLIQKQNLYPGLTISDYIRRFYVQEVRIWSETEQSYFLS